MKKQTILTFRIEFFKLERTDVNLIRGALHFIGKLTACDYHAFTPNRHQCRLLY